MGGWAEEEGLRRARIPSEGGDTGGPAILQVKKLSSGEASSRAGGGGRGAPCLSAELGDNILRDPLPPNYCPL